MNLIEGTIYHIYNRGNKQQPIFFENEDYDLFLKKIQKELLRNCEILCYSLMPNHFHLIVLVKKCDNPKHNLNNAIGILLRSYTRSMQKRENFIGSLFQQKTKAKELFRDVNDVNNYLAICAHYIHLNPKRAGLVDKMEDWKYSSFRHYINIASDPLCNKTAFYNAARLTEEKFIEESHRLNG